jgi:RimJ/RimL family protein N-acetyltransferase
MDELVVTTPRLELIATQLVHAQLEIADFDALVRRLGVPRPGTWPPPLNDEDSQKFFLTALENAPPGDAGWLGWYCVQKHPRALIGNLGFRGPPDEGLVEIGYSLLPDFEGQGFATEATEALIDWAFSHRQVRKVIARTWPDHHSSIAVMRKCGLVFAGAGAEEDGMATVQYEITRAQFLAQH